MRGALLAIAGWVCISASIADAQRAEPLASNPDPDVRRALAAGGGQATIQARIAVDARGATSVRLVRAADGLWTLFHPHVEQALKRWKFAPAMRDGQPVVDTIELTFRYLPGHSRYAEVLGLPLVERMQTAPGHWTFRYAAPLLAHVGAPPDTAIRRVIVLRAISALADSMTWLPLVPRIICVDLPKSAGDVTPTPAELTSLARPGLMAVDLAHCPQDRYWMNGVWHEVPPTRPRTPNNERAPRFRSFEWIRFDTIGALIEIATDLGGSGDMFVCFVDPRAYDSVARCARRGMWVF